MLRGDILLISYLIDPLGYIIRFLTHSKFNHIAVALDNKTVIDLRATKLRVNPLKNFLNKKLYSIKTVRIKNLTIDQREHLITFIQSQKQYRNYFAMIVTYLFIILNLHLKISRLSCSGVIAVPLSEKDIYFCDKDPRFVTPGDIDNSDIVEEISEKELIEKL